MPRCNFRRDRSGRSGGFVLTALQRALMGARYFAPNKTSLSLIKGSGTQTITRATTATVMGYAPTAVAGDSQVLLTVALNEARFQGARRISEGVWSNVLSDGTAIPETTQKGVLSEPTSTNSCRASGDLSNASYWALGTRMTVTPGTGYSDIYQSATTEQHVILNVTSTITSDKTIYAVASQLASGCFLSVRVAGAGVGAGWANFDLANGTVIGGGTYFSSTSITPMEDGKYLCSLSLVSCSGYVGIGVVKDQTIDASATEVGDITKGCRVYRVQQEPLLFPTSYIPATTAPVTRNADIVAVQTSGNIGTTGSVAFKFTPSHRPSGTVYFWGTYTDASNWVRILHDGANLIMRKRVAGTNYDAVIANAFVAGITYKVSARFGTSGQQIALNGVLGTANTNATAGVIAATMQWGADGNSLGQPTAALKDCYTADVAWTDAQLIGASS